MLYAHYDKETGKYQLLLTHLDNVANQISGRNRYIHFDEAIDEILVKALALSGYYHDIGKAMPEFQDYIRGDKSIGEDKNHALISAVIFVIMCSGVLDEKILYLSFLAILNHHKKMEAISDTKGYQWQSIGKKAKSVKNSLTTEPIKIPYLSPDKITDIQQSDFNEFIATKYYITSKRRRSPMWFFMLQYIYSKLISADKLDSADLLSTKEYVLLPVRNVDNYIREKNKDKKMEKEMQERRQKVKGTVLSTIDNLTDEDIKIKRIFTLTAPTGTGKTLTSIAAVLNLSKRIYQITGHLPSLITAIPFVNIIEQTKEEYEAIFSGCNNVLVHHSMTDFDDSFKEDISLKDKMLLTNAWDSNVILTTFVQFFESILTSKNQKLLKLNKLAGSIVILDEIQALPMKYYPLIGALIKKISDYYGTRFILMTATQPKIVEFSSYILKDEEMHAVELLKDYKEYYKYLKRTRIVPIMGKVKNNNDLINLIKTTKKNHESAVVVVNTIKRSIEIYNLLKAHYKTMYLSTNIIPKHRAQVIADTKFLLENQIPCILVSTQTIEAGVDLDFDIGYRDIAPLESVIQTAGRVNREGRKGENRPLYIIELENDKNIYRFYNVEKTKEKLKNEITEDKYHILINDYYDDLLEDKSYDTEIWEEGILQLEFSQIDEFQLIDSNNLCSVLIEADEFATTLIEKYCSLRNELKKNDDYEIKSELKEVVSKLGNYMVQIRVNKLIKNRPYVFKDIYDVDAPFYIVPKGVIERYYDKNTGYIVDNSDAFML